MNLAKASKFWLFSGSGFLLLTASYASSMHNWLQQQPLQTSSSFDNSVIPSTFSSPNIVSSPVAEIEKPEKMGKNSEQVSFHPKAEKQVSDREVKVMPSNSSEQSSSFWLWQAAFDAPALVSESSEKESSEVEKTDAVVPEIKKSSGEKTAVKPVLDNSAVPTVEEKTIFSPLKIEAAEYDDEIIVEFPKRLATVSKMKRTLSHLLLSANPVAETDLMANRKFDLKVRPYYYNRILDKSQHSIRYPAQAYEYAKVLLADNAYWVEDQSEAYLHVRIPLSESPMPNFTGRFNSKQAMAKLERYKAWATYYARQYRVPADLVLAIMRVESAFNPQARSRSNAIGLMQIKAGSAGRDVYELIDGEMRLPSEQELFDEENNIRIGTAYLSLLNDIYFNKVQNPKNRELLVISAYNAGLNTVLKLFANNPEEAITEINRLSPEKLYRKLRYQHETEEARYYLDKVLFARKEAMS